MCYTLNGSKEEQWRKLPWNKFNKQIRKIQERIYDASCRNDLKKVRSLQKVLVGQTSSKFIAVKRISQDFYEKRTEEIENINSLVTDELFDIVDELKIDGKANSICRIYISKQEKKQRTAVISEMKDRAKQALLLMALEPEWKARFDLNSYHFKLSNSYRDARAAICKTLKLKPKYVYCGKIEGFFEPISHSSVLSELNTVPIFRKQIEAWLKAGIKFDGIVKTNTEETSTLEQISHLLINVMLNGFENYVLNYLIKLSRTNQLAKGSSTYENLVVRYADNFVIICPNLETLEILIEKAEEWLNLIGLKTSKEKSIVSHTLEKYQGNNAGFSFLGVYFVHKKCGIGRATWVRNRTMLVALKYYFSQTPDKRIVQEHINQVKDLIKSMEKQSQEKLINTLNPIIRDWRNYYAFTDNKYTFRYCDQRLFLRLVRYACNRHKTKGKRWILQKYFRRFEGQKWLFSTEDRKHYLLLYSERFKENVYAKVESEKSPDEVNKRYWKKRSKKLFLQRNAIS